MLSQAAQKDPAMSGQLKYERREADFYATPPENLDCLAHYINLNGRLVWEPACGEGHLSKRMRQLGAIVFSSDLHNRGYGTAPVDFLRQDKIPANVNLSGERAVIEDVITNPPYGTVAEEFIRHALNLTQPHGGLVAMFLRNEYDMASTGRDDLFEGHPAYSMKIAVTKRPRWIEGSTGSPRHNYAWYVWDWRPDAPRQQIHYIHPKNARPIKAV